MPVDLITGCSSGFGLRAALHLARRGDTVVATMRDPAKAGALERARQDEGLSLEVLALDVTDDASVAGAVAQVLERHGRIDVLVNNAGVGIDGAVEDVTDDEARGVFDTNVFGVLRMLRAVLPAMRRQGAGTVVNVSSLAGRVSAPFGGIYAASKFALEAISESLHYELGPFGIRVAIIEPGGFPTEFDANRRVAGDEGRSPYAEVRAAWEEAYERLPGRDGPPADPEAVAVAIGDAAHGDGQPLRRLVGDDAELIGALRADLGDADFEQTIRSALDFWTGARR